MLSLFKKNPTKTLQKRYERLLQEAMQYQRKGDIRNYSRLSEEADQVLKEIDQLAAKG